MSSNVQETTGEKCFLLRWIVYKLKLIIFPNDNYHRYITSDKTNDFRIFKLTLSEKKDFDTSIIRVKCLLLNKLSFFSIL